MSSSGSGEQRAQRIGPAEQHLGDRLAAFVDGELADDARDRVQAHLATCPQCKAAATEQRRLKSVVAASELPAISAGLMARLQGLAACGPKDGDDGTDGRGTLGGHDVHEVPQGGRRGPFDGGLLGSGVFGSGGRRQMSYLVPAPDLVAPGDGRGARGFRIHEAARSLTGEPSPLDGPADPRGGATAARAAAQASRSRRFAFAAAGAFSMAAIAIGGALPMEAGVDGSARPDDGPAVTPFSAANSVTDTHGTTPRDLLDAREERRLRQVSVPLPGSLASAASVASVTSVALSGAQATPGALPAGAFASGRPPALNGLASSSAALH
ncbi:zf-HC2 domain-containing protein [Streptomyces cocklensis]|uniref:Zinc-finger n=1 Tax=Actinacidiphila cocklensis TaxID=887465 RepID=A0A9W4GTQ4_9ACTN|nr:zf-HC2 domain-containing protein [Actinacidiphila cocklensis]MDD1062749.1 zf-HC2 domain-containing protein [Actinacidiphila cocklensis]WSX76988.1 zf-HC2 domain-containing protein [Streptomyces sp. NBC_00899]CAG6396024.1 Putative zinc-finger [Actinacidiphila cocklensis]